MHALAALIDLAPIHVILSSWFVKQKPLSVTQISFLELGHDNQCVLIPGNLEVNYGYPLRVFKLDSDKRIRLPLRPSLF